MDDQSPDLVRAAWEDAARAAELAERLAQEAADAARRYDTLMPPDVAEMAEATIRSAERAADWAREVADEA
ncbi:MAG TPA: hypothetical protein VF763_09680 [Candidatus Limnocylindrales bacterium]